MKYTDYQNFQLAVASIIMIVAFLIAFYGIIISIAFEISNNRLERKNDKARVIPFSDDVNNSLEMTLDIKSEILKAGRN